MTDAERIKALEEDLDAARATRDAYAQVARLALRELTDTRELLDSVINDLAKCRCQCTTAPARAHRLD